MTENYQASSTVTYTFLFWKVDNGLSKLDLTDLGLMVLESVVAAIVTALLSNAWGRLRNRNGRPLLRLLERGVTQAVQVSVKGAGVVGVLFTVMFQLTPAVMAVQGGLNQYPPIVWAFTLFVWELIVLAMFKGSVKLVRFRFRFRRSACALGHGFPIAIWNPPFRVIG